MSICYEWKYVTVTQRIPIGGTFVVDRATTIYTPKTVYRTFTETKTYYTAGWRTEYIYQTVYTDVLVTVQDTRMTSYVTEEVPVEGELVFTKYVKTLLLAGKLVPTTVEVPMYTTVVERVRV
jgi:hypothetical protein